MSRKLLVLLALTLLLQQTLADFSYDPSPKEEDLERLGLKCVPGRTVIRVQDQTQSLNEESGSEEDLRRWFSPGTRRGHMNFPSEDENCKTCVCSVDGRDEYCKTRPAKNVNECVRMAQISQRFKRNEPYDLDNVLPYRIRRVGAKFEKCVPFVSEYTDCSADNLCTGCTRCSCGADGSWACRAVSECPRHDEPVGDEELEDALDALYNEISNSDRKKQYVTTTSSDDLVLEKKEEDNADMEKRIMQLLSREKRSATGKSETHDNGTISFYHTIDEVNEDTLKNTNVSGTLQAVKVDAIKIPLISRRTGQNISMLTPLHIEYNQPQYHNQIAENKIEDNHVDEKLNTLGHEKISDVLNHTQAEKNKDLPKLIVTELKSGSEIIGDKNAPVMSNITFTPENDTLTAMAFIAGNLLNKLWSMEKVASDESEETEMLKHEKINDLLDLFKEPLTLRQENFLKSALEKISDAMDKNKDVKNISICEDLEQVKEMYQEDSNSSEIHANKAGDTPEACRFTKPETITKQPTHKELTVDAISKINHVLDLMNKFEGIQKHLNDLKQVSKHKETSKPILKTREPDTDVKDLSDNDNASLNTFGKVLEKITKLIMPTKSSKKMVNRIRNQNLFLESVDVKQKFKDLYKIDLGNFTLSTKDKLVLDYLTTIASGSSCFNNQNHENVKAQKLKNIEGDILLNLSEFFKIKSFADLMKMMEPERNVQHQSLRTLPTFTENDEEITTSKITTSLDAPSTSPPKKTESTKEKLKTHLKTILEDLIELQKENGINAKEGSLKITDALPCIYKIINSNFEPEDKESQKPRIDRIKAIFESLRNDLKTTTLSRRNNEVPVERPASAVVWERVVKAMKKQRESRRNLGTLENKNGRDYTDIKIMIDLINLRSNTYKKQAQNIDVKPNQKLSLLKTLQTDVKQYIDVLQNIKQSLENISKLPMEQRNAVRDFVLNAGFSVDLNNKIVVNINKPKKESNVNVNNAAENIVKMKLARMNTLRPDFLNLDYRHTMKPYDVTPSYDVSGGKSSDLSLTRDELVNQLIKNRVTLYLKLKESKDRNPADDTYYNIGKSILFNIETGNYGLAKELYKVFVARTIKKPTQPSPMSTLQVSKSEPTFLRPNLRRHSIQDLEPLIQFGAPKTIETQVKMSAKDQLLRQLLNVKNLRI